VQLALVQAVVQTGKPTVVVLINGGAVAIEWIQTNVPAILEAFYAGEMASFAIADVLFGDYNPGGKLPYTIFPANYVNQISLFDMNMNDAPGRTYRYYTETPLWPFGFGLSYTQFQLTWESGAEHAVDTSTDFQIYFRVTIKNIGKLLGDEVALAYVNSSSSDFPLKQLFGFQRVTLAPGQETEVFFGPTRSTFATVTKSGQRVVKPGLYHVIIGNGVEETSATVRITGKPFRFPKFSTL